MNPINPPTPSTFFEASSYRSGTPILATIFFTLALSGLGYAQVITPVAGASWLKQLHRPMSVSSLGQSSRVHGPAAPMPSDWPVQRPIIKLSSKFTGQGTSLYGSDLYRFKCQGCHGPTGEGSPPEINSVLDPVRATSASMYVARMKKVGMDVTAKDAASLARNARTLLLDRLHKGGTDMPSPNPYLTTAEVNSLFAYLRQLAGIPGAQRQQVKLIEPPLRVGEHIVKSTCHICHAAFGPNPTPQDLLEGEIPPLNTLMARVSFNDFVTKVTAGMPVLEGRLSTPARGRMPVFTYLTPDEAADVYLYLSQYPPTK